jgi:DNA-binding PadR family transcriptional regulator
MAETPEAHLPLTPAVFHILLALADGDRHGYAIAKEVAERTDHTVRLGPGTLYGTLTRMLESGLIEEGAGSGLRASSASEPRERSGDRGAQRVRASGGRGGDRVLPPNHERRRYYRLTALGRQVAKAEARRLASLVAVARDKALLSNR